MEAQLKALREGDKLSSEDENMESDQEVAENKGSEDVDFSQDVEQGYELNPNNELKQKQNELEQEEKLKKGKDHTESGGHEQRQNMRISIGNKKILRSGLGGRWARQAKLKRTPRKFNNRPTRLGKQEEGKGSVLNRLEVFPLVVRIPALPPWKLSSPSEQPDLGE